MKYIFFLILILFTTYGLGRRVLSFFIKQTESVLEEFIFSSALGLAILGYLVYIIGSLGFLYQGPVLLVLISCGVLSISPIVKFISNLKISNFRKELSNFGKFEKFLATILVLIPVVSLFGAMSPPIGNDALAYHLDHSKIFVERHNVGFIPFTRESLWPYLGQMFFTTGLLFQSVTLAKIFHYLFGILTVLSVFSFTRRFFSSKKALLASVLFVSAPGIFTQMTYAYVDLAQCFFSFLALYLALMWIEKDESGLLILSGIFSGLALSVKLISAMVPLSILFVFLMAFFGKKTSLKKSARYLVIFGISAFVAGFVWYLRSYIVLSNPVYPFLHNIFGAGWATDIGKHMGMRRDLIGFLLLPWDMTLYADSFGGEQIGILFLVFLPMLFFLPVKDKNIRYILMFFITYAILWFIIDPMMRFSFVNFAVAFILIAVGFYECFERYKLSSLKKILVFCVVFNLFLCVYHNVDSLVLISGKMTTDEYLDKKERTYPVAEYINGNTPEDSVIIVVGESRGFYFNRKIIHYNRWKQQTDDSILSYIYDLKSRSKPVYLLYRDDTDPDVFSHVMEEGKVLYSQKRIVDRGKKATYYIYNI